jgi:uncharacterized protein YgiM (DUF1202 family)
MGKKLILILFSALVLSGCSLPSLFQKKFAALQISSNPQAKVYLNDEEVGETPFTSEKLKSQDYTVRLVPKDGSLSEWSTTVALQPNITTIITHEFGKDDQQSSGIILTLEKSTNDEAAELAVVSIPDNASVKLDGQPKGFTPLQVKKVTEGTHTLVISAPGYKQKQVEIKTVLGYKLLADVQLAKESLLEMEASPSAKVEEEESSEQKEEEAKKTTTVAKPASPSAEIDLPYVEILDTPTGWLRVRSNPTTAEDNEIAKINPGEKYPYLESNDTGWHKISLNDDNSGWISGRYSKVFK